jgi:epoxyqueuosine reductase QueG
VNADLQGFVKELFQDSGRNRLPAELGGGRIFSSPALGVSGGDDPIFLRFKEVVHTEHLTPEEMWARSGMPTPMTHGSSLRVISILFPYENHIRTAGKAAQGMPPEVYCVARNLANGFQRYVQQRCVAWFERRGHRALAGSQSPAYEIIARDVPRLASTWSERHLAFAAGLGTFSLHEGFISEAGCNIRLASVLTDAPLAVTPRRGDDPFANCLHYATGTCGKCVDRCPGGALSREGHDKIKCWLFGRVVEQEMSHRLRGFLKAHRRLIDGKEQLSYPVGCALCQFGVPCMDRNPVRHPKGGDLVMGHGIGP